MTRSILLLALLTRPSSANGHDDPIRTANTAAAHLKAGRYQEAEGLFEEAIAAWRLHGAPETDWAVALGNLGTLHSIRGHYERAEAAFQPALEMAARLLPPDDLRRARLWIGIGNVYTATGRFSEARRVIGQAAPACRKSDSALANAADAMGRVEQAEGAWAEAEEWFRRAAVLQEKAAGPHDVETAMARNNLAVVLRQRGNLRGAAELHRQALADLAAGAHSRHPVAGALLNGLGQSQQVSGDWQGAKESYEKAIALWRQSLGPDHHLVAGGLVNLAAIFQARKQYGQAEAALEQALAVSRRNPAVGVTRIAMTMNNLASVAVARKQYLKAGQILRESIAYLDAQPGHPDTGLVSVNLGEVHRLMKNYAAAEQYYARGLAILELHWTADDSRFLPILEGYAVVLRQRAGFAEAERVRTKAMRIRVRAALRPRT